MPLPSEAITFTGNLPPVTATISGGDITFGQWLRSSFVTGNNSPFVVSSVTLRFREVTQDSNLFVGLYNDSNGTLGSQIIIFTNPSFTPDFTDNYIFTLSTPQLLLPNTTYWLVARISSSGSGLYRWALTNSNSQSGHSSWSIGDSVLFSNNQSLSWTDFPDFTAAQFSINGQSYSPVAGDPYFSNVVLFLKGSGENNSTNIIDSSSNPKSITVIGNTRISTDQSRFDNSSIVFNGGGDSLSVSNNDFAFGSGDFTIEAWVRPTGSGVAFARVIQCGNFGSGGDWQLVRDASGGTTFGYWFDIDSAGTRLISSVTVNSNAWHFITIVRENSTVKMAINGAVVATGTSSQNLTRTTITIGASEGGGESNSMFLDELRITKGIAREITLPTNPFPNL